MNNHYEMSYVSNLNDVFNHIKKNSHHTSIFINLDNTVKLLNLTPVIYKNNPFLRTKLISRTKNYDFTLSTNNCFLKKIIEEFRDDPRKIYVITNTNFDHQIKNISSNIVIIRSTQFDSIVKNDTDSEKLIQKRILSLPSILIVDTNENISKQFKNKQNIQIVILKVI